MGDGLKYLFNTEIKPQLDQMREQLLTNEKLDEETRRAYIIAIRTIQAGFQNLYAKASLERPPWLD